MKNKLSDKAFTYDLTAPEIKSGLMRARKLVQKFNRLDIEKTEERNAVLKELLGSIGEGSEINQNFYCDFGSHIFIGKNFFCNYNCTILDIATVKIGDNCLFAPNVSLYTAAHPIEIEGRLKNIGTGAPIEIGNGVWIGGNSVILGGVSIGDNAVIGAGSVVIKDVESNTVVAGNPAKPIKRINNYYR